MKQKPFYYVFLSFFLLLITVSIPLQIMYVLNFGVKDFPLVFNHLTYQNWITMIACGISMYFAWTVSPKLNYIVSFLALTIIINNLMFGSTTQDYSIFKTTIASFLFLIPFSFLLVPEYQEALKNKTKHWWKTPTRYKKEVVVNMEDDNKNIFSTKTINISKTGALLLISSNEVSDIEHLINQENKKPLKLKIYDNDFETEVDIIRLQKQKESENYQLAVNFKNISYRNKYKLYSQVLHH